MKAGDVYMKMPVRINRPTDDVTYTLHFELAECKDFVIDTTLFIWKELNISNLIQRPAAWNASYEKYYFMKYSRAKHEWMNRVTGIDWNDEVMMALSYAEIQFWKAKFMALLAEENALREDPLTDEDEEVISFN